jgi:hypothetical protein
MTTVFPGTKTDDLAFSGAAGNDDGASILETQDFDGLGP